MEIEFEQPSVRLRISRTPRNKEADVAVRESLLSDSTSGIVKGEADEETSIGSSSFSSPDLEVSKRDCTLSDHYTLNAGSNKNEDITLDVESVKSNRVSMTENLADVEIAKREDNNIPEYKMKVEDEIPIPDGGWGWVVVISSFIISMIADGISFSFGLLYIEFLEEFEASKSTTAWIGSLFIAVPLLAGPVMSALVDMYGCRSMTIAGGIISTLGFVLASISNSLETMMITFGVIAGLGLGLVYVTAVVSIAFWFDKKRNLAVGLGACGTGVGTFVYAPMTQYFIEEYGWRGTILLLSGTLLNLCVCGCVMRDPEWLIAKQIKERSPDNVEHKNNEEGKEIKKAIEENKEAKSRNASSGSINKAYTFNYDILPSCEKGRKMRGLIEGGITPEVMIRCEATKIQRQQNLVRLIESNKFKARPRTESMGNIPSYLEYDDEVSKITMDLLLKYVTMEYEKDVKCPSFVTNTTAKRTLSSKFKLDDNSPPAVTYTNPVLRRTQSEINILKKDKPFCGLQLKNPKQGMIKQSKSEDNKILLKQDSKENKRDWLKKQLSVNHHYLKDLKMSKNSISHRNAMLNIKGYRLKASSCPDIFKNSMISINEKEKNWYDDSVSCFSDMFNVELFKKMTFNLLCLGTIILFTWFIVPYFYLAEHMVQKGYSEDDGAVMLSLIGITNTIGMIGLGWIGDFPQVSICILYAICLILCGVTIAAIPFAVSSYWILASISSTFGLLFAASFTFTPSLLVQLVSLDDFTTAYGLVLLAQGIGHLIGPPMSGLIFDLTLSWELSFYLAGGWIIVAGILISCIHPVRKYLQRRENLLESATNMA